MAHVPHVYLPPPWQADALDVAETVQHHLHRVMRLTAGAMVTYTDGTGMVGSGTFVGDTVLRGDERIVPAPADITLAVAPPHSAERSRFLVEKSAELGVRRVLWLASRYGDGRPPKPEKAHAWCVAALQQSHGAHLTTIGGPVTWEEAAVGRSVVVADPSGSTFSRLEVSPPLTLCVGPEGGFAPDEVPEDAALFGLGDRILRTETAAIAALSVVLAALR